MKKANRYFRYVYIIVLAIICIISICCQVMASGRCRYKYSDGSECGLPATHYKNYCDTHYNELYGIYSSIVSDYNEAVEDFYAGGGDTSTLGSSSSTGRYDYGSSRKSTYSSSVDMQDAVAEIDDEKETPDNKAKPVYDGKTYEEADVMAEAGEAIENISPEERLEEKDSVVYVYKIGETEADANSCFQNYQTVLTTDCGLSLQSNMDGSLNVMDGNRFIAYICVHQESQQYRLVVVLSSDIENTDYSRVVDQAVKDLGKAAKYESGMSMMESGDYKKAIEVFEQLGEYKDIVKQIEICNYNIGWSAVSEGDYAGAYDFFLKAKDYEEAPEMAKNCEELLQAAEYEKAQETFQSKEFDKAKEMFTELGEYANSRDMVQECEYQKALQFYYDGKVDNAKLLLEKMPEYKDAAFYLERFSYKEGLTLMEEGNAKDARTVFSSLGSYKDSKVRVKECDYRIAQQLVEQEEYENALDLFVKLGNYKDSSSQVTMIKEKLKEIQYSKAVRAFDEKDYETAVALFEQLGEYQDSSEKLRIAEEERQYVNIQNVRMGDVVTFGFYPQEADGTEKAIQWIVTRVDGDSVLLFSKYVLDYQLFNATYSSAQWSNCTLRQWLNNDFFNIAFTDRQKICLVDVTHENDEPGYPPAAPTVDKVWLHRGEDIRQDEVWQEFWFIGCDTGYAATKERWTGLGMDVFYWLRSAQYREGGNGSPHYEARLVGTDEGLPVEQWEACFKGSSSEDLLWKYNSETHLALIKDIAGVRPCICVSKAMAQSASETPSQPTSASIGAEQEKNLSGPAIAVDVNDPQIIRKVQEFMNRNGYDVGAADGIFGDATKMAVERYQAEHGMQVTGTITGELLEQMG